MAILNGENSEASLSPERSLTKITSSRRTTDATRTCSCMPIAAIIVVVDFKFKRLFQIG